MARRKPAMQTAHNKGVLLEAQEHERQGWNVQADIRGWPSPPLIAGRQPDVYATKNGYTRIVEVETNEHDDHDQHATFRRHAGQKDRTSFYVVIVNSAGRRVARHD